MSMFTITVPASSANIGPGFDSVGMAINRYLTLQVTDHDQWIFEHHSPFLPVSTYYKEHFIYQIAEKIALQFDKKLPTCKVYVKSKIPLARGLGSSASAVVAGIELANQLCDLSLTMSEKLQHATEIEGHPDNVAPALLGGLLITAESNHNVDYVRIDDLNLDIVLFIPDLELKTKAARDVLPTDFSRNQATTASSTSNLFIASLLTNDYRLAGKMMEQDLFHEPYRAKLIPNYEEIKHKAKQFGAYGTVISGAGPTMLSFVPKGKGQTLADKMHNFLNNYNIEALQIDRKGLQINVNNKAN